MHELFYYLKRWEPIKTIKKADKNQKKIRINHYNFTLILPPGFLSGCEDLPE